MLKKDLAILSHDHFNRCLHCLSCAGGCPVVNAMDYRPNGIIRLMQLGYKKKALKSRDIWLCIGCHTCETACPMSIPISKIMDGLRQSAIREKTMIPEPDILHFHKEVLDSILRYGRTHKLEIMLRYKLKSRQFFSDMNVGLKMLSRRKIEIRPSKIQNTQAILQLYAEYQKEMDEGND